jgi:DNA-binding IclR family transcriptional regulator
VNLLDIRLNEDCVHFVKLREKHCRQATACLANPTPHGYMNDDSNQSNDTVDTADGTIRAVDRALKILLAFDTNDAALNLTEIARRSGLNKSTALRLLSTLESRRFVARLESGSYQLGSTVLHLGNVFRSTLRLDDYVLPSLRRLTLHSSESSVFFVREGDCRLCISRVDSGYAVRTHAQVGDRIPLPRGAFGRVIEAFPSTGLSTAPIVPGTVAVYVSYAERDPQTAAVACPVFGEHQRLVGSIGVSLPVYRYSEAFVAHAAPEVLREAIAVTEALGGDASFLIQADAKQWKLFSDSELSARMEKSIQDGNDDDV